MPRSEFEYDINFRLQDRTWQVVAKLSAVRLGIVSRDDIKQKSHIDQTRWLTVYTGKSEKECRKWVDSRWENLLKLGIPYEIK